MYKYAYRENNKDALDQTKPPPFFSPSFVQAQSDKDRDAAQGEVASNNFQADTADPTRPAKIPDWSPEFIDIEIASKQAPCLGEATRSHTKKMSQCNASRFCMTPAHFTFRVWFHYDVDLIPRPQPFSDSDVSVDLQFTPEGEQAPSFSRSESGTASYAGPGTPLKTPFGDTFSFDTEKDGVLHVSLNMTDLASGLTLHYVDDIQCTIIPCS
jgi:hypothetical protein